MVCCGVEMRKAVGKFNMGKPGYGCKDGKLYRFEKRSVLVLSPWPEPQAWFKSNRRGWHSSRKRADKVFTDALYAKSDIDKDIFGLDNENDPSLKVWEGNPANPDPEEVAQYVRAHGVEPQHSDEIMEARRKIKERRSEYEKWRWVVQYVRHLQAPYFDAIPEEVRNELLRYHTRRWHLLCLFARCPGTLDLSRSNPALCYALASNWVFHKPAVRLPLRAARSLIIKKQKHVLAWLGFPGTETARRIMAKLDPRVLSIRFLLRFREVLGNTELVTWLSHLRQINPSVAEMATKRRYLPFLTPRLLREASLEAAENRSQSVVGILDDTLRMSARVPGAFCPPRFMSRRQLARVHDELARQQEQAWERNRLGEQPLPFPCPPFAGTQSIQPILTPDALHAEGREMGHCVGIYDERVAQGRCFIYRVTSPVRATMEIFLSDAKGWMPGQLRQSRNKPVPEPTAGLLFNELLASGKPVARQESETLIGRGPALIEAIADDDQQMHLFNCDQEREMVPF